MRIESQQVQHGSVDVRDVVPTVNRVETKFVRSPVNDAPFESGAGHPNSESVGMMIPPVGTATTGLDPRCAAKLRAKHHDGLFPESCTFEVLEKSGHGLVDFSRQAGMIPFQVPVRIPCSIRLRINLHKPRSAFNKPACGKKFPGDVGGLFFFPDRRVPSCALFPN